MKKRLLARLAIALPLLCIAGNSNATMVNFLSDKLILEGMATYVQDIDGLEVLAQPNGTIVTTHHEESLLSSGQSGSAGIYIESNVSFGEALTDLYFSNNSLSLSSQVLFYHPSFDYIYPSTDGARAFVRSTWETTFSVYGDGAALSVEHNFPSPNTNFLNYDLFDLTQNMPVAQAAYTAWDWENSNLLDGHIYRFTSFVEAYDNEYGSSDEYCCLNFNIYSDQITVPEPTAMLLVATGLVGLIGVRRKQKA